MDDEESQNLQKLLETHRMNMHGLKEQKAKHGIDVPLLLSNSILHEEKEIANIEAKLNARTLAINRIDLEQNRQKAWRAFYRRNWEEAVELLEKVAVENPDDKDIQNKLTYAHWQLRLQRDYCNICCLRDEDDPQAVLNALEDLSQPQQDYPGKSYPSLSTIWEDLKKWKGDYPNPDQLKHWAEEHQRRDHGQVPLLGIIAAGEPLPDPEDTSINRTETIEVPSYIEPAEKLNNVYALRVRGRSMIDDLIDDGDIVLVRYQETAENGQKVVAFIKDENSVTLKRFYKEGKHVRLQPANPTMKPIIVDAANVLIWGRVIGSMRKEP